VLQNELFERGVRAQQRGDSATALATYADLIERYPSSPLVENALVGRIRLLEASDKVKARYEAARYLDRYARGFARAEAQRILESP
jgi:outer membrane protein assembly factor BamD (BamD/ComL family)